MSNIYLAWQLAIFRSPLFRTKPAGFDGISNLYPLPPLSLPSFLMEFLCYWLFPAPRKEGNNCSAAFPVHERLLSLSLSFYGLSTRPPPRLFQPLPPSQLLFSAAADPHWAIVLGALCKRRLLRSATIKVGSFGAAAHSKPRRCFDEATLSTLNQLPGPPLGGNSVDKKFPPKNLPKFLPKILPNSWPKSST